MMTMLEDANGEGLAAFKRIKRTSESRSRSRLPTPRPHHHDRFEYRFDEAEREVERGEPWLFREPGTPNPLTIEAERWSTGHTKLGEADFLSGRDRDGKLWSVLVGGVVLKRS